VIPVLLLLSHMCLDSRVLVDGFTVPNDSTLFRSEFLQGVTTASNKASWKPKTLLYNSKDTFSTEEEHFFDPLGFSERMETFDRTLERRASQNAAMESESQRDVWNNASPIALAATVATAWPNQVSAAILDKQLLNTGDFNPDNFKPVCATSDGLYRFLQGTTQSLVGTDNFVEYGPLIAGGLLRIRLELCVVESFFNEAVGPFIEREGLGWVLPLHETVETFLAGTIFALASTFILVGSTKIVSVLVTYGDVFIGGPCRLLGGFSLDRALGRPVTLDIGFGPFKTRIIGPKDAEKKTDPDESDFTTYINEIKEIEPKDIPIVAVSGALKVYGETSKIIRELLEGLDLFVGRYLTLIATGYVGIKFIHFKVFPDFPPF